MGGTAPFPKNFEFYLQWLKYKTAKPLLYTVYRTIRKCTEQLGRTWSGKEMSFEAIPENSQRGSWGDVGLRCP